MNPLAQLIADFINGPGWAAIVAQLEKNREVAYITVRSSSSSEREVCRKNGFLDACDIFERLPNIVIEELNK